MSDTPTGLPDDRTGLSAATTSSRARIEEYRKRLNEVRGWMAPSEIDVLEAIDTAQRSLGVDGDILEIGVFEGKSAILLGFLLGPGEKLVVADLFEDTAPSTENQEENTRIYQGLRRTTFDQNFLRFHDRLPTTLQRPSGGLANVLERRFRMIHLDGSHLYEMVRADIETARALIAEDGVLVLDDYTNFMTPGVCGAVWERVVSGDLQPICASPFKLYTALNANVAARYREALLDLPNADSAWEIERAHVARKEVLTLLPRRPPRPPWQRRMALVTPPILLNWTQRLRHQLTARLRRR